MSLARQIVAAGASQPETSLLKYDAACRALAEAKTVDEAKEIHNRSEAMRAYARQAKNKQLEVDAAEIRIRAERRLGEMISGQKATVGLNQGAKGSMVTGSVKEPVKDDRPTLAEAGIDKKLSARAQKMAAVPEQQFEAMVGEWRGRVEAENERVTTNLLAAGEKKLSRDAKEAALAARITALPNTKFGVILADPPWRFEPYSRDSGMDRAADNHYPTMDLDAIKALDVPAADDCALFLWATAPMLPEALAVMAAWGFTYKSQIIWNKDRIGTGYWARNKHELLLIGTRGDVPAPAPGTQPASVIDAPVSAHSAKPLEFHEIIERIYPTLPKLEMFARTARLGWQSWGAEAEQDSSGTSSRQTDMADVGTPPPTLAALSSPESSVGVADEVEDKTPHVSIGGAPAVAAPPLSATGDGDGKQKAVEAINERCKRPASCKFSKHPQKITCSDCSTAWAIAQRKRVAA